MAPAAVVAPAQLPMWDKAATPRPPSHGRGYARPELTVGAWADAAPQPRPASAVGNWGPEESDYVGQGGHRLVPEYTLAQTHPHFIHTTAAKILVEKPNIESRVRSVPSPGCSHPRLSQLFTFCSLLSTLSSSPSTLYYTEVICSRLRRSQGLLYKHLCNSLIESLILCENILTTPPRPNSCRWCF